MANLRVEPRNAERVKNQVDVTLYFIGVEMVKDFQEQVRKVREQEDDEAARLTAASGINVKPKRRPLSEYPEVTAKGRSWRMPQLGESMTVKEATARDLQFMSTWKGQRTLLTAGEGGEAIATLIKEAIRRGEPLDELDLMKVQVEKKLEAMTDEEVITLLKLRDLPIPEELRNGSDEEVKTEPEEPVKKAPVKRKPKSIKKDES